MLELSKNEFWCCATILNGFKLWNTDRDESKFLALPNGVRNISKRFQQSSNIILSAGDKGLSMSIVQGTNKRAADQRTLVNLN